MTVSSWALPRRLFSNDAASAVISKDATLAGLGDDDFLTVKPLTVIAALLSLYLENEKSNTADDALIIGEEFPPAPEP